MAENLKNEFKIYVGRLRDRIDVSSLGFKLGKWFQALLILAMVLFICYGLFVYFQPDENGIKAVGGQMTRGIQKEVYHAEYTKAIETEGIGQAKGIQEMNNARAGSGGETIVKLKIAKALEGKRIILLPGSEGGMNLKTMGIKQQIETLGEAESFFNVLKP